MPYLSTRALEGLRSYQYKPSGYTILDELHQPVWNCEYAPPLRLPLLSSAPVRE